jgi:hypothetical protein
MSNDEKPYPVLILSNPEDFKHVDAYVAQLKVEWEQEAQRVQEAQVQKLESSLFDVISQLFGRKH